MSKMKNLVADVLEKESILIDMTDEDVKWYFDKEPDVMNGDEWIYVIEKCFFGLMTKKLYLYFYKGKIYDFFVE